MQIHPAADSILVSLHVRDTLGSIDPKNPDNAIAPVRSLGCKPKIQEYAALEYSPGLGSLVYYSAADGAVVHAIDWEGDASWRALSAADSFDPIVDAAAQSCHHVNQTHTFGRFRIAHFDDFDLAVLVRHVDSPVYAMRLPG